MFLYYAFAGFVVIMLARFIRRTDLYQDVCVGTFVMAFMMVIGSLGPLEGFLRPLTWDARLRAVDLFLRLDGFAFARFCGRSDLLSRILSVTYSALPLAFSIAWVIDRSKLMLRSATIGGLLAFPIYLLVPACGPKYAFATYPWGDVASSGLVSVPTIYARNCVPSMHFSWALLLAMNARKNLWKAVLLVYSGLMAMATVAGGEHYFIDLILAIPFCFIVQKIAELWPLRKPLPEAAEVADAL